MAERGVDSWHYEQLYGDEAPQERFGPERDANGSPSRSACWKEKDYAEAGRPGQGNRGLEPLPAEVIMV